MRDRVTRRMLERQLPHVAQACGYFVDGEPADGEERLILDYSAECGGYKLAERTYRARESDGLVVPSGESDPFGPYRHSAREMFDIMRAIVDAFYRRRARTGYDPLP